jgi:hypothetical protein
MATVIFQAIGPAKQVMLYGNTYPHREAIRTAGGKWDAKDRCWYLPEGTDVGFLPAGALYIPPSVSLVPVVAPVIVPRRRTRDGACCEHATAYWPDTGPYSHYGPATYRCVHHGESRSNYSGT